MRKLLLAATACVTLLPFAAAHAQQMVQSQEGIALQNQIYQLQQQVQQMQSGGGGGGGSSYNAPSAPPVDNGGGGSANSGIVTSLLNQVQQLQAQVQQLSGQVDTLQNQVNSQHDASEKEIGDLRFQVTGNGGGQGGGGSQGGDPSQGGTLSAPQGASSPPPPPPTSPAASVPSSPRDALRTGQAAFAQHNYTTAEANARSILAHAKSTPEGYQAQYLLAQSLAGENKSQDAAIAYDDAYNRDRTGTNAPASLLGLANSLTAIHQASAACDTLASLNSQFPTPPAGMATRIQAASHRAHCS